MDLQFKQRFLERWKKYFGGAELPITFFYSDDQAGADRLPSTKDWHCLINDLKEVRGGRSWFQVKALSTTRHFGI